MIAVDGSAVLAIFLQEADALAGHVDASILFKGDDFTRTDPTSAA